MRKGLTVDGQTEGYIAGSVEKEEMKLKLVSLELHSGSWGSQHSRGFRKAGRYAAARFRLQAQEGRVVVCAVREVEHRVPAHPELR